MEDSFKYHVTLPLPSRLNDPDPWLYRGSSEQNNQSKFNSIVPRFLDVSSLAVSSIGINTFLAPTTSVGIVMQIAPGSRFCCGSNISVKSGPEPLLAFAQSHFT
jgi:hypothetical protein